VKMDQQHGTAALHQAVGRDRRIVPPDNRHATRPLVPGGRPLLALAQE
jgi:hypothetical protein